MGKIKQITELIGLGSEGLKNFHLIGHSFGGYIAGNYCLRYKQNVKKLILVSPVGILDVKKEQNLAKMKGEELPAYE